MRGRGWSGPGSLGLLVRRFAGLAVCRSSGLPGSPGLSGSRFAKLGSPHSLAAKVAGLWPSLPGSPSRVRWVCRQTQRTRHFHGKPIACHDSSV